MNAIIRGTTPTITFTFDSVDPADFVDHCLTIKSVTDLNTAIIQTSNATIDTGTLSYTLAQVQTLALTAGDTVNVYCDWLTTGGVRGRSVVATCRVFETGKDEVMV